MLVVILVNLPILALTGVEGKMFTPMAMAVIMALLSALVLSLTFVPAAVALFMTGHIEEKDNFIVRHSKRFYAPVLAWALKFRVLVLSAALIFVVLVGALATRMGTEFILNLDEAILPSRHCEYPAPVSLNPWICSFNWKSGSEIRESKPLHARRHGRSCQ